MAQKELLKEKKQPIAILTLTNHYTDSKNLDSAIRYYRIMDNHIASINSDHLAKFKKKYDLNDNFLQIKKRNIDSIFSPLINIKSEPVNNGIEKLKYYLKVNNDSYLKNEVIEKLIELEFLYAKQVNTIYVFDHYMSVYPNSKFLFEAKHLRDRLEFNQNVQPNNFRSYKQFALNYEANDFADSAIYLYHEKFMEQINKTQSIGLMVDYLKAEPYGKYRQKILGKITQKVENGDVADFNQLIDIPGTEGDNIFRIILESQLVHGLPAEFEAFENKFNTSKFHDHFYRSIKQGSELMQSVISEYGFIPTVQETIDAITLLGNYYFPNKALDIICKKHFAQGDTESIEAIISGLKENGLVYQSAELEKIYFDNSEYAKPTDLGSKVNIPGKDAYSTIPTANNEKLYFLLSIEKNSSWNPFYEDAYYADLVNGSPKQAKPFGPIYSNRKNESVQAVSTDGNKIVFFENGTLKTISKTKNGWDEAQDFFSDENQSDWDGAVTFGSNGRVIIFESKRSDQRPYPQSEDKDDIDLYISFWQNGEWSLPVNLGRAINTPFDDRTPFLHPDMKTLYFSTPGLYNFGSSDVFMTKRIYDSSWFHWTKPINLGRAVNTPNYDYGFKMTTNGEYAYIANQIEGNSRIVRIKVPDSYKPENVAIVSGLLMDKNKSPLNATMIWEDLNTGENMGQAVVDPETGYYFIVLPTGRNYGYYVSAPGYYPVSKSVDLSTQNKFFEVDEDIELPSEQDISDGAAVIVVNNIFFDLNSWELKPQSNYELNRLSSFLKKFPSKKVEIAGHTDITGTDSDNMVLSKNRAHSVMQFLLNSDIESERMVTKGYGSTKPVAPNSTTEGRAKNRRVEIRLY